MQPERLGQENDHLRSRHGGVRALGAGSKPASIVASSTLSTAVGHRAASVIQQRVMEEALEKRRKNPEKGTFTT